MSSRVWQAQITCEIRQRKPSLALGWAPLCGPLGRCQCKAKACCEISCVSVLKELEKSRRRLFNKEMREQQQKQASVQRSLSTQTDTAALSKWDYSHQQLISPVIRTRVIASAEQTQDLRQAKCSYTSGGSSIAGLCPGSPGFTLNGAENGQGHPSEPGSNSREGDRKRICASRLLAVHYQLNCCPHDSLHHPCASPCAPGKGVLGLRAHCACKVGRKGWPNPAPSRPSDLLSRNQGNDGCLGCFIISQHCYKAHI